MTGRPRLGAFIHRRLLWVGIFWAYWGVMLHLWEYRPLGYGLIPDAFVLAVATEIHLNVLAFAWILGLTVFARWRYGHWRELDGEGIDLEEVRP